eukprot:4391785-Pyramimonas_sp.AAC.1
MPSPSSLRFHAPPPPLYFIRTVICRVSSCSSWLVFALLVRGPSLSLRVPIRPPALLPLLLDSSPPQAACSVTLVSVGVHRCPWICPCTRVPACPGVPLNVPGRPWMSASTPRCPSVPLDAPASPWKALGSF